MEIKVYVTRKLHQLKHSYKLGLDCLREREKQGSQKTMRTATLFMTNVTKFVTLDMFDIEIDDGLMKAEVIQVFGRREEMTN